MRAWSVALLVVLSCVVVPGASAQDAGTTWFLNDLTEPDGSGAFLSIAGPAGNAMTSTETGQTGDTELSFSEKEPGFAEGYVGGEGEGSAFAYIKSWNFAPAPATKVVFTIKAGDDVIGTGSQTKDVLAGAIVEFAITFPYEAGDLPAGTIITMDVTISNALGGTAYYPRGDGTNHWRVSLPVTGVVPVTAPSTVYENLTAAAVDQVFENATTGTYVYNFTTDLSSGAAAFLLNGTGNATTLLMDGNGTILHNGTFEAGTNETLLFDSVAPGNWSMTVSYQNFTGSYSFLFAALPEPEIDGMDGGNGTVDGNETTELLDADDKGAPGVALPMLSLALVAMAFALRRRA